MKTNVNKMFSTLQCHFWIQTETQQTFNNQSDVVNCCWWSISYAEELDINLDTNMEDIMQHFNLTIIASLEPDMPWSRDRLDTLEADMMERMMTMERYGGINLRVERMRGQGGN